MSYKRKNTSNNKRKNNPRAEKVSKKEEPQENKKGGIDSDGVDYSSIEEIWKEGSQSEANSEKEKAEKPWYSNGAAYWSGVQANVDGMLGGFAETHPIDIAASTEFLQNVFSKKDASVSNSAPASTTNSSSTASTSIPPTTPSATETTPAEPPKQLQQLGNRCIDCGAGIGRVSKALLAPLFKEVDLVEQDPKFVETAKEYLKENSNMKNYFNLGLQKFTPEKGVYDLIWNQWVLSQLTDDDLVEYLKKCKEGITEGGFVAIKENICEKQFVFDKQDSSVTRTQTQFRLLIEKAGLKVVSHAYQKDWPKELFPVIMFACRPV